MTKGTMKKSAGVTGNMIAEYEGNNRQSCLFCGREGIGFLDPQRFDYSKIELPKGFSCTVWQCQECFRAWAEITKFVEVSE